MAVSISAMSMTLALSRPTSPEVNVSFSGGRFSRKVKSSSLTCPHFLSSLINASKCRFPPNMGRQINTKPRRNRSCSKHATVGYSPAAKVATAAVGLPIPPCEFGTDVVDSEEQSVVVDDNCSHSKTAQLEDLTSLKSASFFSSNGSVAVHAGERLGRGNMADAIITPVVNTSAYFFKKTADLLDFKEKRRTSFEYGRYGNPTTAVAEEKISALEGAESTLLTASGMCAITVMLLAMVPAGGHIVTTTECYSETRTFIQTILPRMGITATAIEPADVGALESALDKNKVSLFYTESPTNPFLRCVDIQLVSKLCHEKGVLVCIDGTFASPINQKTLSLGADLVLHSATKYIGGHHDVIAGCISGPEKLISAVRNLHHIMGGAINPNAAYQIIRGMKTLHLRLQQQNSTAMRMAQMLEAHRKVRRVYYPGLPSDPDHHIAKQQMVGFGGVISFEVDGDLMTTAKFVDALKIPYIAASLGGCESIVQQPAIMSSWDLCPSDKAKYVIMDNLVRFSFGVEEFEELSADILQALETI